MEKLHASNYLAVTDRDHCRTLQEANNQPSIRNNTTRTAPPINSILNHECFSKSTCIPEIMQFSVVILRPVNIRNNWVAKMKTIDPKIKAACGGENENYQ